MNEEILVKRFATIAVEKGFITRENFLEARRVQLDQELEGQQPNLIGRILHQLGYITDQQINEVLSEILAIRNEYMDSNDQ